MAQNFAAALSFTLGEEGGYHAPSAADPNPTNYGIRQDTYDIYRDAMHQPRQDVKAIAFDEVRAIYSGYWKGAGCEYVGPLTALTLFEMSVNGGIGTAAMMLQTCVGVKPDGVFGPATQAAIQAVPDAVLATRFEFERLRRYLNIAEHIPREAPNFLGWVMRTVQYREQYLKPAGM